MKIGDTAEVKLNALPDMALKGVASNIGPILDPNIRTAKVRIEVRNPGSLKTLEEKGEQMMEQMQTVPGIKDIGLFRDMGQPNLDFEVDRKAAARFGINVADIQNAIQTAVGICFGHTSDWRPLAETAGLLASFCVFDRLVYSVPRPRAQLGDSGPQVCATYGGSWKGVYFYFTGSVCPI